MYESAYLAFNDFLQQFDLDNEMIKLKISHSYHVVNLANILGKRLELSKEDLELFKVIALLHDIGRFIQYEKSSTYNDLKSHIDHAKEGIDYLFKDGHIKDFKIPEKYHEIIKFAITNHNKYQIQSTKNDKELFFAKLIRDVDKIDIFRACARADLEFRSTLSKNVSDEYFNSELVKSEYVETRSDLIINQLSFVFDIEFKESFILLDETDNLELYLSMIDVSKEYDDLFIKVKKHVRSFLEEKLKEE